MRLDAHQHFWSYDRDQYPWIPRKSQLARDWLPADLAAIQQPLGFEGSIAVQARQSMEESRWLLELADRSPRIHGVVGWVDLRHILVEEQLDELCAHPKFVGVRHVLQDEPDEFMLTQEFLRGISKLSKYGLQFDLLILARQLPAAIELTRRFPNQSFVLDHMAKPEIRSGSLSPWCEDIRELATSPNVHCKVSGMLTEADHQGWKPADFTPYLETVFEAFGVNRLMFGSDWPVCLLAGSYQQTVELVEAFSAQFPVESRDALFGGNARRFYL